MSHKIAFYVSLGVSVALLVAGFVVPPTGIIDPSVLTATGILFGFATLGQLPYILEKAKTATIKHGDTEVTISKNKKTD